MSLQLALTQLESLAAMLNERKRESEQYQAFRETIKSIGGGKFVLLRSIVDDPNRILLRQDLVTQLEFEGNGGGTTVSKSKSRKLLLLNDMLICTTQTGSSSSFTTSDAKLSRTSSTTKNDDQQQVETSSNKSTKSEKSVFKWSFPVRDVEVEDISISPTMSRFVQQKSTTTKQPFSPPSTEESASTTLLEEMQSLMHDYEVLSRILGLVSTLKTPYDGLSISTVKELMLEIQHQIRCRDEQISYFDSSCLTLLLGNTTSKEKVVFQMSSPEARAGWIEELRLAQLALDPSNAPAWDIPSESPYPSHKLPLFVKALPLSKQPHLTSVKAGVFFTHTFVSRTGRSKILDYLWVSSTDGLSSHCTAYRSQQNALKEMSSFDLVEEKVNDMIFVQGYIWLATESRK
jgi:Rho guanine nucleotide exchange factor 10